jgi:Mce-associated membrane protein
MRLSRRKRRTEDQGSPDGGPNADERLPGGDIEPEDVPPRKRRSGVRRALVFGLLPGLAMLLAGGVGYLKWQRATDVETRSARIESLQAASESTVRILSYSPDTVDGELQAARDRLTGTFRDAYTQLIHDVVIPGSKEKKISALATVPAAASISASPNRAVVMVFVNQSITVGNDPPSTTASTVRVTMDRRDNHWLISDFTPI